MDAGAVDLTLYVAMGAQVSSIDKKYRDGIKIPRTACDLQKVTADQSAITIPNAPVWLIS